MRQVPSYCLIGRGRLGRHLSHYFDLLGLDHVVWGRDQPQSRLDQYLSNSSVIILCIPDDAIESFIQKQKQKQKQENSAEPIWLHCSGALVSSLAYGVHPLMTFGESFYSLATYRQIPLVLSEELPAGVLSELANPRFVVPAGKRALYHAWCVLAGSGSCLLWQRFQRFLAEELAMPVEVVHPYMRQVFDNVMGDAKTALTGPWPRGDSGTVGRHISALGSREEASVYQVLQQWFDQGEA